jgi:Metallo-beta-lactamase superfamily
VFVGAYEPLTINICVIRDRDRLVLVDSRASATEGAQLAADLTWFAPAQVQALINTHAHFDHTFGNQHFGHGSATAVPIYGHHLLPAHLDQYERPRLEASIARPDEDDRSSGSEAAISDPGAVGGFRILDRLISQNTMSSLEWFVIWPFVPATWAPARGLREGRLRPGWPPRSVRLNLPGSQGCCDRVPGVAAFSRSGFAEAAGRPAM